MYKQAFVFAYIAYGTNVKFKCMWNFISYVYFKCNLILLCENISGVKFEMCNRTATIFNT